MTSLRTLRRAAVRSTLLGPGLGETVLAQPPATADTIYLGGIITMEAAAPKVEAVAIRGDTSKEHPIGPGHWKKIAKGRSGPVSSRIS